MARGPSAPNLRARRWATPDTHSREAPHLTYSTQEQLADHIPTLQQEAIDNGTIDDETLTQIADLEEE